MPLHALKLTILQSEDRNRIRQWTGGHGNSLHGDLVGVVRMQLSHSEGGIGCGSVRDGCIGVHFKSHYLVVSDDTIL